MNASELEPTPAQPPLIHRGVEADARDYVQIRLGFLSLVIWFVVAFAGVVLLNLLVGVRPRAGLLLQIGLLALGICALPWLGYRRWVQAVTARMLGRRSAPR